MPRRAPERFAATLLALLSSHPARSQAEPADAPAPSVPVLDYDLSFARSAARPVVNDLVPAPRAEPADPLTAEGALTVMAASLNRRQLDEDTIFAIKNGAALVPAEDIRKWRLRTPGAEPVMIDAQAFLPLAAVPGLTYSLDREGQRLILTAAPEAFESSVLLVREPPPLPSAAARTAFLNYDLSFEHSSARSIEGAFLQMGASDSRGLIANTMTVGNSLRGSGAVRLDTYFIRDDPKGLHRLTIGDGFTRGSTWEGPVRMGGVRYGTDFGLQPTLLPFPTPTFGGRASIPSNIQIYVNNVMSFQAPVREGPFTLDQLPVVTGSGQAALVIRDALGTERRVVSRYYVSTSLLRPGLVDYSLEAGAERYDYGRASFDYGRPFAAATYRRGLTRTLTVETRGEAARDVQSAGVGFVSVIADLVEIGGTVAGSHSDDGSGYLYRVSAGHAGRFWSFAFSYQAATRDFSRLGLVGVIDRPVREFQASGGLSFGAQGSLNGGLTYLRLANGTESRIASARYSRPLFKGAYLDAFALRSADGTGRSETTFGASISLSLGSRTSGFVQVDSRNREVQVQRPVPEDGGWGYRVIGRTGEIDQQQADLLYRNRALDATIEVARYRGELAERVQASGGLVFASGSILPTRRLSDGYAIVEVPGQANVTVFQENRPVAATNARGIAIVTRLRPYETNRISVAPDKLGLDTTIRGDTLQVVPRYLSGVRARFDVAGGHAGSLLITLPDGRPLEPGTPIAQAGRADKLFSGFDGEVFMDDIVEGQEMVAERTSGACRVRIPVVPKGEMLPRIGPVVCVPVEGK